MNEHQPVLPPARWYRGLSTTLVYLAALVALCNPLWFDGRAGILDTPVIAHVCRTVQWHKPLQLMDIMGFGNQARPLQLLAFLPALVSRDPQVFHWFQNVCILVLTYVLIARIVSLWTGMRWLASFASVCVLLTPSYTSNYFTMWTMEPYMLFGVMGLVWVWVRLLGQREVSRGAWWWYNGLGVIFAAYAIGVKEVGVMACVVCMAAGGLIAWQQGVRFGEALRRVWPTFIAAQLAFTAVIVKFMLIPQAYDAGGTGGYVLALEPLLRQARRFVTYFIDTAPYAWLAALLWMALAWFVRRQKACAGLEDVRRALAGAAVFFVIAVGMAAIYVPWQVFDARYLLVAGTSAALASWLTAQALLLTRESLKRWYARGVSGVCAALIIGLIVVHACYVTAVGPLSEGLARHRFAVAYDEMFKFVCRETPTNGTVYFLMDWDFPEARENTVHSLDVFYGRPDIRAAFPTNAAAFTRPGLVVVSEYSFPMNYTRMPVHYLARDVFYRELQPRLGLREVANMTWRTPIWYAKEEHNVAQYQSAWGVPAFWDLKRGVYRFGWRIYWYDGGAGKGRGGG